jgi:hypothetical protein
VSDPLVEDGWVAPASPGPRRVHVAALIALGAVVLLAWGLGATGWLRAQLGGDSKRVVVVATSDQGDVIVDGRSIDVEQRARAGVTFVVAHARLQTGGQHVRPRVQVPSRVDPDSVAVRVLQPRNAGEPAQLLVTVPLDVLPDGPDRVAEPPALQARTDSFDERVRAERTDHELLRMQRRSWWWIAPLALAATTLLPLLLWRRSRRVFRSMRVPGPGTQLNVAPPSSLDPIGAAVIIAGARPVDEAAAFAGHVLDLVERRQLPMRRSTTTPPGLGTLVGMHHADELTDPVVPLLGSMLDEDSTTVALPDNAASVRRVTSAARDDWHAHVQARAVFERVVAAPPRLKVLSAATASAGGGALAATVAWTFAEGPGRRAALLLVAVSLLALAATLGAWLRDARTWRVVARSRRTERAQWLAWRASADTPDGPSSDERNLPVLVAIGAPMGSLRSSTSPSSVDMAAVTTRTIAALRTAVDEPTPSG